jgi:DNA modification methylase
VKFFEDDSLLVLVGDCREQMAAIDAQSVQTIVTSPPYWGLRDYGQEGQLGLESSPDQYVSALVEVFRQGRRVLKDNGTLWLNLGDSYFPHNGTRGNKSPAGDTLRGRDNDYQPAPKLIAGTAPLKGKDLVGIPWRVAFALQQDGWYLRSDIIWNKPNPMPESVIDRPTRSHEYIFLLSKSERYFYDAQAIKEPSTMNKVDWNDDGTPKRKSKKRGEFNGKNKLPGKEAFRTIRATRNKRSVWTVNTGRYKGSHFATFPSALIEPCILAGAPAGGVVLDPFGGSGTTGLVANQLGRKAVLIELNPEYAGLIKERCRQAPLGL